MEKEFQDLFQIRHNDDRVEVGKVLIAEPFLEGKYFNRSVVYMVEHDPSGSVGFVLNKPLPYTTSELVKELEGVYFPVYIGGPVERNQLYYIHRRNDIPDSEEIAKGIYWGGDFKEFDLYGQITAVELIFKQINGAYWNGLYGTDSPEGIYDYSVQGNTEFKANIDKIMITDGPYTFDGYPERQ